MSRKTPSPAPAAPGPADGVHQASARARLLEKVKARLLARGLPRLQMSLIVACTGAAGFVASFLLLHLGLRRLWPRYALAVVAAYGVFLLLVRLWLAIQRRRLDLSGVGDGFNVDLGGFPVGGGPGGSPSLSGFSGGGGSSGGGGATVLFDEAGADAGGAPARALAAAVPDDSSSGSSGGWGSGFSLDLDGDELVVVVVVVAVLAASVAASVYVVVSAPALFAEVLVDGTLSAGLYRHVKGLDEESWLEAALRRTWIPFAVVALFFVAAGVALHRVAPEAASMREVVRHVFGPTVP